MDRAKQGLLWQGVDTSMSEGVESLWQTVWRAAPQDRARPEPHDAASETLPG
jgi:hypothetical protein